MATEASTVTAVKTLDIDALNITSLKIRENVPTISDSTLQCDRAVVVETLPAIKSKFAENGLEEDDALDAVNEGWMEVRFRSRLSPSKCMVQSSFQQYVGDLGKMIFRTTPDHAAIEVGGASLHRETSYKKWYPPKTYNVKYTKEGFRSAEKQCEIVKSTPTDCFAELVPNP
jgi:hypothetical protein